MMSSGTYTGRIFKILLLMCAVKWNFIQLSLWLFSSDNEDDVNGTLVCDDGDQDNLQNDIVDNNDHSDDSDEDNYDIDDNDDIDQDNDDINHQDIDDIDQDIDDIDQDIDDTYDDHEGLDGQVLNF